MIQPTRVYRCRECGTRQLGIRVRPASWHYDGSGSIVDVRDVLCLDSAACGDRQVPAEPVTVESPVGSGESDIPF